MSSKKTEVELVKITVAELGFKDGATRKDIHERAFELGLKLCPNEVGPALRLQYTDQPMGKWILVAMESITGSDGDFYMFTTVRDSDSVWLHGDSGYPVHLWDADDQWVFSRGK